MIFDDSDKKADARVELLLEAIENKDKDTLHAMFSEHVLSEIDSFTESIDDLFHYFQGSIQSKERGPRSGRDERNVDGIGNRRTKIITTYTITTSKQEYRIAIYDVINDAANPSNVGIQSLCIISTEDDQESEFTFWGSSNEGINIGKSLQ